MWVEDVKKKKEKKIGETHTQNGKALLTRVRLEHVVEALLMSRWQSRFRTSVFTHCCGSEAGKTHPPFLKVSLVVISAVPWPILFFFDFFFFQ